MCIIQLQHYIMSCWEYILTKATIYQMLDKSKMNPRYDLTNLKVIIMMNGIQENQIIHQ